MSDESTAPDLVERWQQSADAHARRDFDAMTSFFAPDAVWDGSSAGVGAYFEGVKAIRGFLEDWIAPFEEYEYNLEESQDLGNGVLFFVATYGGRPAGTGGRVQERRSYTVTWAVDLIASVTTYPEADIDNARAAAERLAEERGYAMSQENVDLVRSIYEAWERADWSSSTWAHPDIEYVMVDEPGANVHEGSAAMARAWGSFLSAWEDYRLEPVEYRTLDQERVLVFVHAYGRGKSSGVELDQSTRGRGGANLFHIRDGRVVRLDAYFDRDRALADLGLEA